jgi:hypothetical protein
LIRLTKIDGTTVTVCECDICGGRMYSVHQGVVLQPHGGPAKHVHRGKCNEIATQSYGWLQTRTALESHISDLAALLRHVPCELGESTELSPAKACSSSWRRPGLTIRQTISGCCLSRRPRRYSS